MPLADDSLLGALLRGLGRLLVEVFVEWIFEGLIQRTGAWIGRLLRPGRPPGELLSTVLGLLFWGVIVVGIVLLLR